MDQETLQAGVIWALGRVKNFPGDIRDRIIPKLIGLLDHPNAGLRGLAAWSLGELNAREALPFLEGLPEEDRMINLIIDEKFTRMPLSQLTIQAKEKLRDL